MTTNFGRIAIGIGSVVMAIGLGAGVAHAEPVNPTVAFSNCFHAQRKLGHTVQAAMFDCCIFGGGTWKGTYPDGYCQGIGKPDDSTLPVFIGGHASDTSLAG